MIAVKHQDILCTWLCQRIGLVPTNHMRCIANLDAKGRIIGVVGFDGYNDASVLMHAAGEGNWLSRSMLFAIFDYAFRCLKCNVVIALVPSGNKASLRLVRHAGFTTACVLEHAHPDGALVVATLHKNQCRFLTARYGRELVVET